MPAPQYAALIPSYEHERLEALKPYQVHGTPGQGIFNDFVSVVAKLLDMPIALISLVQADEVVFVGNAGLPGATAVAREDSLCSVAILDDGPTVFEDLGAQPCALINPFVGRQLGLGFYAGQALRTPAGLPIGSLCVIDRRPRRLSPAESQLLTELAGIAYELLWLQAHPLGTTEAGLRAHFDGILQASLTRLATLAGLREWEDPADAAAAQRYGAARLEESQFLIQRLRRALHELAPPAPAGA